MILDAKHIFKQKRKLNRMRERKLPKGRTKWTYEDELDIQTQSRVLEALLEEIRGKSKNSGQASPTSH